MSQQIVVSSACLVGQQKKKCEACELEKPLPEMSGFGWPGGAGLHFLCLECVFNGILWGARQVALTQQPLTVSWQGPHSQERASDADPMAEGSST